MAPFSFFNALGSEPVYVLISIGHQNNGAPKDTARNIKANGEFVINMVTEDLLAAMNISAADFPPDQSELVAAELRTEPSMFIKTPHVAQAQVSMECKLHQSQLLGTNTLLIGEVVMFHVADHLIGPRLHINDFAPISRLGSPSMYCRTSDRFDLPRINHAQWQEGQQR